MEIMGRNCLVIGMAKSGISAAKFLAAKGAGVSISDNKSKSDLEEQIKECEQNGIKVIAGKQDPSLLEGIDLVVVSPGVPLDIPILVKAKEENIPIVGEIELASRFTTKPIVAITGTNGKTTTTSLTDHILKRKYQTAMAGNIGFPFIDFVTDETVEAFVLELSSFQLETVYDFKPHIAAILNITPDHIIRHKTMENYIHCKKEIFKNQGKDDFLVLNKKDEVTRAFLPEIKTNIVLFDSDKPLEEGEVGTFVLDGKVVFQDQTGVCHTLCDVEDIRIKGKHNLENVLAAGAMAYLFGIKPEEIKEGIRTFEGVEHRLEVFATIRDITFINDSKGTNPDASIKALEAMDRPTVLILGGYDKGNEFDEFVTHFKDVVKSVILLGETRHKIEKAILDAGLKIKISMAKDLAEVVKIAYREAKPGDAVLLSPACASWDMFDSYEQRGDLFKKYVREFEGVKE